MSCLHLHIACTWKVIYHLGDTSTGRDEVIRRWGGSPWGRGQLRGKVFSSLDCPGTVLIVPARIQQ